MKKLILAATVLLSSTSAVASSFDYHCVDQNPERLSWTRNIFVEADPTEISVSVNVNELRFTNSAGITYHYANPGDATTQLIFGNQYAESPLHTKGLHAWVAKQLADGSGTEGRIYINRNPGLLKYVSYNCRAL